MALDYRQISINRFETITKFKLSLYLIKVDYFFNNNYKLINDWYSGKTDKPDSNSFKFLKSLISDSDSISELVYKNSNRFDKTYFWDLLENLEDIKVKLTTTTNLSKFLRSIITNNSYQGSLDVEYTLNQGDTLERIQHDKLGVNSYDDAWINIALRNDLSEEDYDGLGGQQILIPSDFTSLFLNSVVDNLVGDKLYGKDFNRKITFVDDDLEILDYKPTVQQSVEILISIRKGSVPEFLDLGISEELVVGSNRSTFALPVIQRQISNLFNTDDSFLNFEIQTLTVDTDAVYITFVVNTVRGNLAPSTLIIKG